MARSWVLQVQCNRLAPPPREHVRRTEARPFRCRNRASTGGDPNHARVMVRQQYPRRTVPAQAPEMGQTATASWRQTIWNMNGFDV